MIVGTDRYRHRAVEQVDRRNPLYHHPQRRDDEEEANGHWPHRAIDACRPTSAFKKASMPVRLDKSSADNKRFQQFLAAKREVSADVERQPAPSSMTSRRAAMPP